MNRPASWRTASFCVALGTFLLSACAYLRFGMVCDAYGNCAPGPIIEGVFCPNGEIKPRPEDCDNSPRDDGPQSPFGLSYSSNYGLSMHSNSNIGVLQLYRNGALRRNFSAQFTTIGNTQRVTYPDQLRSAVEAEMTSQTGSYSFELKPPTIHVSTSAPPGATVTLTAKLKQGSIIVASKSMTYIADVGGGPPRTTGEFPGPN
jgi:hypothetical protein